MHKANSDNKNSGDLMSVWETKKLGEICKTSSGGTPSRKNKNYFDGDIPWVKSGELDFNTIKEVEEKISEGAILNSSAKVFPKGTLLIALYGATVGKLAFLGLDAATNQAVCAIMPKNGLENKYLYWYLFSRRKDLVGKSIGGAQPNISQTILKDVDIPYPPLQTQHRIVEKIEELFSELDNGVANLKKAQKQLKTYRQAVLKDAFEGKLTAAWREQQTDLPSPEELLQQIQAERQAHRERELAEWEAEVQQWELDGKEGRKPTKPRKEKSTEPIIESDKKVFSNIPKDWMRVRPGHISSPENYSIGIGPFGSNLKVADYRDSGVPLIFVRNITNEDFKLNQKFIDEKKFEELKAHSVKPLDILVTKMGDPPGDSTIYPEGFPKAILTADCLKFRVAEKYIERKFYRYCLESVLVKRQLGVITKGVAQKKISAGRFKTLIIPLPSLEEQIQIVQEIESRLSIVDQLEKTIEENLLKAEALRQSILKKAFNGELVEE